MKNIFKITYLVILLLATTHQVKAEEEVELLKTDWSFKGLFGKFDRGSLQRGYQVYTEVCASCHSINKGGKNNIGPALYNVVGRKIGEVSGYKYSKALAAYDKEWTFEELNGFLIKPTKWIKGTKMAYAGLRKEKDRASVIKYLNKNSDNPVPLP